MIRIRTVSSDDLPAVQALFTDTVRRVNSRDYPPEHIDAWAAATDISVWQQRMEEQYFIAAFRENEMAGFASLAPDGYLDFFYVSSRFQRAGVGKKLMGELHRHAAQKNIRHMYSSVSITAQPFFLAMGFHISSHEEKIFRGLLFINARMEKIL